LWVTFRSRELIDSIVVQITRRTSGGNARTGVNSLQCDRQTFTSAGSQEIGDAAADRRHRGSAPSRCSAPAWVMIARSAATESKQGVEQRAWPPGLPAGGCGAASTVVWCLPPVREPGSRGDLTLKAVVVGEFGGPNQLRLGEVPDPVPGPGQVRVAVRAAGVNPVDAGNRADGSWAGLAVPCVLGYDIAGVIDSVGPGVEPLGPGDRVMAMTHFPDGAGGYAELAVVDAALIAPIGPEVSFVAAAATPLAAGTALEVMSRLGRPAGGTVLVLGGSGGVGLFMLQWRLPGAWRSSALAGGRCTSRCLTTARGGASTTRART
jgi:Alcohol dehydrogenase GroES-like domain